MSAMIFVDELNVAANRPRQSLDAWHYLRPCGVHRTRRFGTEPLFVFRETSTHHWVDLRLLTRTRFL